MINIDSDYSALFLYTVISCKVSHYFYRNGQENIAKSLYDL